VEDVPPAATEPPEPSPLVELLLQAAANMAKMAEPQ
jgi:hypothetical protein